MNIIQKKRQEKVQAAAKNFFDTFVEKMSDLSPMESHVAGSDAAVAKYRYDQDVKDHFNLPEVREIEKLVQEMIRSHELEKDYVLIPANLFGGDSLITIRAKHVNDIEEDRRVPLRRKNV